MTNNKISKIASFLTIAALSLFVVPSASANTHISISGNGAFSDSYVSVTGESSTEVSQSNEANVENNINTNVNTGNNRSSFNTGGDITIHTGKAESNVAIVNNLNRNIASIENGSSGGNAHVEIRDNGAFSDNSISVRNESSVEVTQSNEANVENNVDSNTNSGGNTTSFNTHGDTTIHTGNANSNINISNNLNHNIAQVHGSSEHGSINIEISGNGAGSHNYSGVDDNDKYRRSLHDYWEKYAKDKLHNYDKEKHYSQKNYQPENKDYSYDKSYNHSGEYKKMHYTKVKHEQQKKHSFDVKTYTPKFVIFKHTQSYSKYSC